MRACTLDVFRMDIYTRTYTHTACIWLVATRNHCPSGQSFDSVTILEKKARVRTNLAENQNLVTSILEHFEHSIQQLKLARGLRQPLVYDDCATGIVWCLQQERHRQHVHMLLYEWSTP